MSAAIPFELSRPTKLPRAKTHAVHLGAAGEAWCEQQHELLARRGVAVIEKLNPPTFGPNGRMSFARRSNVDYGGYLLDGSARAVLCECKGFAGDRLALSVVKEHQRARLDRAHAAGALAILVMIELRTDARGQALPVMAAAYAVPWWRAAAALDAKGHGSLLVRDVVQHRVRGGDLYLEPWVTR